MGGSFILILLLLGLVMWISGMRSSETGYNWNDFMADYEADQISSAVIKPNAEVPTGSVIFTMKDGSSKELFVSDVTVVEEYMHQKMWKLSCTICQVKTGFVLCTSDPDRIYCICIFLLADECTGKRWRRCLQ